MRRPLPVLDSLAPLLSLLVFAGCATGSGSGGPAVPDISGTWVGGVTVEGQTIEGTLILSQDGTGLTARFDAPAFGLTAEGGGSVDAAGEVDIRLDYNLDCPGSARLDGARSADGAVLSGVVQAQDCTGQMVGAFDFRRTAGSR